MNGCCAKIKVLRDWDFLFADNGLLSVKSRFPQQELANQIAALCFRGKMNTLSGEEKSYLAGLIDGEGCLTITRYQGKSNRTPVYTAVVVICMTDRTTIEHVWKLLGVGSITYQDRVHRNPKMNACYRWTLSSPPEIAALLIAILDLLIVKREEAKTLLEFVTRPRAHVPSRQPKPKHYVDRDEAYYRRMKALKTRGRGLTEERPFVEPAPIVDLQLKLF